MQLTELRKELKFNEELLSLLETLKNIAASQYHMMEREKQRFDQFMNAFSDFFRVVDLVDVDAPLVRVMSDVVGVVIVEVVFVYPGLGQLLVDSVSKRDLPVVQASCLIFAAVYIGLNLLADVLSIISNPRMRNPR